MGSYQTGDRRPLASRGWKISEKIARWLAERGATPNAISIVGMVCGILAGIMFSLTTCAAHPWFFLVSGAVFVQLRLLANLYDGMVAVLRETASPVGELFNEVPDRVSDAATLIGFGYATGSDPVLGFVATIFAIFLAYLRAQGKVAGAHQEFDQRFVALHRVRAECHLHVLRWQGLRHDLEEQRGETLVFDARTGMLDLDGKTFPSGMPKYVPCSKVCKHF